MARWVSSLCCCGAGVDADADDADARVVMSALLQLLLLVVDV